MLLQQLKTIVAVSSIHEINDWILDDSLNRMNRSLKVSAIKQARQGDEVCFNCMHHGQYAVFLLFLGNALYCYEKENFTSEVHAKYLPDMIDFINYTVNGVFATCKMELPEIMYFDHPLGSVIGRARIGSGFAAMQNCTIGSKNAGDKVAFPTLGKNVIM